MRQRQHAAVCQTRRTCLRSHKLFEVTDCVILVALYPDLHRRWGVDLLSSASICKQCSSSTINTPSWLAFFPRRSLSTTSIMAAAAAVNLLGQQDNDARASLGRCFTEAVNSGGGMQSGHIQTPNITCGSLLLRRSEKEISQPLERRKLWMSIAMPVYISQACLWTNIITWTVFQEYVARSRVQSSRCSGRQKLICQAQSETGCTFVLLGTEG